MKRISAFAIGMVIGIAVTAAVLLSRDEVVPELTREVACPHQAQEPQWTVHRPSIVSAIVAHFLKDLEPSGIVYIGVNPDLAEIVSLNLKSEYVVSRAALISAADDTYEYKGKPAATLDVRLNGCSNGVFVVDFSFYMGPEGAANGIVKAALIDGDIVFVFGPGEVS